MFEPCETLCNPERYLSQNNFPIIQDYKAYTIHINICGEFHELKKSHNLCNQN